MESKLKLIKTLWGVDDPASSQLFNSIKDEGYDGVEVIRLAWNEETLVQDLNVAGLSMVCQVHTAGGYLKDGEYVYCGEYSLEAHKKDFAEQLLECATVIAQVKAPGSFVNVHAGVDAWSRDEALDFLSFALPEVEKYASDFMVTFETHRQRLFGNPWQTRELLKEPLLRDTIKFNADLSHWYVACERVFDKNENRDSPWWPSLLEDFAKHSYFIHARLGWSEGPQMADPSVEACTEERLLQEEVWKVLMKHMTEREYCFAEPECGPPPYLPVHPRTQEPVASLEDAVAYTKKRIILAFAEVTQH